MNYLLPVSQWAWRLLVRGLLLGAPTTRRTSFCLIPAGTGPLLFSNIYLLLGILPGILITWSLWGRLVGPIEMSSQGGRVTLRDGPLLLPYCFRSSEKTLQTVQVLLPHLPDTVPAASPCILRGKLVWSQIQAHQQAGKGGVIWNRTSDEESGALPSHSLMLSGEFIWALALHHFFPPHRYGLDYD